MKTICITGAAGFVGSRLTRELAEREGLSVIAGCHEHALDFIPHSAEQVQLDLNDRNALTRAFSRRSPDVLIHCAASIQNGYTAETLPLLTEVNVLGSANIVAEALRVGCRKIVFCSSVSVYGQLPDSTAGQFPAGVRETHPLSLDSYYAWTKHATECMLDECAKAHPDLSITSLRLDGIHGIGRKGGVVNAFVSNALQQVPMSIENTASRFKLLFIDDAVQALAKAALMPAEPGHRIYNIAGKGVFTLDELAEEINRNTGTQTPIQLGDTTRGCFMVVDTARAEKDLTYNPAHWQEHLRKMVAYEKSRQEET